MADGDTILGVEPQPPKPFAQLREKCETNGCRPVFRAETFDNQVRFSLAAINVTDERRVYDIRQERAWDDAPDAIAALIDQAQGEWWP